MCFLCGNLWGKIYFFELKQWQIVARIRQLNFQMPSVHISKNYFLISAIQDILSHFNRNLLYYFNLYVCPSLHLSGMGICALFLFIALIVPGASSNFYYSYDNLASRDSRQMNKLSLNNHLTLHVSINFRHLSVFHYGPV